MRAHRPLQYTVEPQQSYNILTNPHNMPAHFGKIFANVRRLGQENGDVESVTYRMAANLVF